MAKPTKGMTTAMLRQLAPMEVIPPSPNARAWMMIAVETERHAAQGPSSTAIRTAPTACAVVPPKTGTLNIIRTKENAAPRAIRGTCRDFSVRRTLDAAAAQTGRIATSITA